MATPIGDGVMRVRFDPDQVAQAGKEQVLPSVKRLAGDAALAFGAVKILQFGKQGLEELKAAEAAQSNVAAVIKTTGGAANVTAEQVDELADSQLKLTGVDDEIIKQGAAKLLTFKQVANQVGDGNDVFDRATKVSLDLAQVGFGSVESASTLLGKALNDPVKGMVGLTRVGIQLTEGQKEQVKALVASGDVLGAQKVILAEVESQVGGAAAAFGQTLPGQIAIAEQSLENMKGELTAGAAPALRIGANAVEFLADRVHELPEAAQVGVGGLVILGGGIGALVRPIADASRILDSFRASRAASAAAAAAEAAAETAAAGAVVGASAARATGVIAATVAVDKATVSNARWVLSDQATVISTGQVNAALAARDAALVNTELLKTRALVSNDALIASEVELAGVQAKTATSSRGLAGGVGAAAAALGPLAIGAGIGAAALAIFGDGTTDVTKKVKELGAAGDEELLPMLDRLSRFDQVKTLGGLAAAGESGVGTLVRLRDAAAAAGDDVAIFDYFIGKARENQVNLNASADAGASALAGVGEAAAAPIDTTQQEALVKWLEAIESNADDAFAATLKLAPAEIRAREGRIAIADANDKVAEAETELANLRRMGTPEQIAGAERDLEKARLDQEQAVLSQADALAELANQQQIVATGTAMTTTETNNFTQGTLALLNTQLNGPTHDAIATYIFNMEIARQKVVAWHDAQIAAAKFVPPGPDIAQGPNGQFDPRLIPPPGAGPGPFRERAAGGLVRSDEVFRGGEQGFEVLLSDGLYQAPPIGGRVLNHSQSTQFLAGGSGGVSIANVNVYGDDAPKALRRLPDELRAAAFLAGV